MPLVGSFGFGPFGHTPWGHSTTVSGPNRIGSFTVETNYKPNSIKVEWTLAANLLPTQTLYIRRSETTYPTSLTEGTLVLSTTSSTILRYDDLDLEDNKYYYYSLFIYDSDTDELSTYGPGTRGFALSYKKWGEGDRMYNLFPEETRSLDQVTTGDLKRLCDIMGARLDELRSRVFVMEYNRQPVNAPDNLLDFFSIGFGFEAERGFDLNVLRRVGEGIVSIYKRKGTVPGIEDFIKLYTEFDNKVFDNLDQSLKLYDEDSKLYSGVLTSIGPNFAQDTAATFPSNSLVGGRFYDHDQDSFYTILTNNSNTIFFENRTPPTINDDSGTTGGGLSDAISGLANNLSTFTGTSTGGSTTTLIDSSLSSYPDGYFNGFEILITSGLNSGLRGRVKSFTSVNTTITFHTAFSNIIASGVTYRFERIYEIVTTSAPFLGLEDNSLKGRTLTITAGTNSGAVARIARNYDFGGTETRIIVSNPYTQACDSTTAFTVESTGLLFQDTSKSWTTNEWRGHVLTIGSQEFFIKSNTSDTLTITPTYANIGSPLRFARINLDQEYPTPTNSYTIEGRYYVYQGNHYLLFDPLIPFEFRNTLRDPAAFLFGSGSPRTLTSLGGLGDFELPIAILNAATAVGRSTNLSGSVLTDANANFTVGALIGLRLNPNAIQDQSYVIVDNTSTTITVTGNLEATADIGNNYYVIDEEGSIKTQRLRQVLPQFVPHYLTPIIFHELTA